MNLYITGDAIGTPTGGGKVTRHESTALASLGEHEIWEFSGEPRPWGPDLAALERLKQRPNLRPELAHFYSGTFSKTIAELKRRGTYVTYTAAAHDIEVSRDEHARLGIPFDYPHLTSPILWEDYVRGYLDADLVICPSHYSANIMRQYGCPDVIVIPHGFDPVDRIAPIPGTFVVGYLGQPGPDKGLSYLIDAWAEWSVDRDDLLAKLLIAGRGTEHLLPMIRTRGAGSIHVLGEVAEPRDLYDACCVYVQPSASEGFGCEVLEARAHGRPVICSDGAGAHTYANAPIEARNVGELQLAIDRWWSRWKLNPQKLIQRATNNGALDHLTWERIRMLYVGAWRS